MCECKELIDKGFIWNPSNSEVECDKSSDVGEYLEYENCKWRLVDKLVEECTENIEKVKLAKTILAENGKNEPKCSFCSLELVDILFATNAQHKSLVLKKICYSY